MGSLGELDQSKGLAPSSLYMNFFLFFNIHSSYLCRWVAVIITSIFWRSLGIVTDSELRAREDSWPLWRCGQRGVREELRCRGFGDTEWTRLTGESANPIRSAAIDAVLAKY